MTSEYKINSLEKCQKSSNLKAIIIIPTLNEEENIAKVIQDLGQMGYCDILIVDARSTDNTAEIAQKLGVNVIFQTGNGKGNALREAFTNRFVDGDMIVIMDADGSMSPKEIPLFKKALDSGADLVKGSRFLGNGHSKDLTLFRKIGNHFLLFLVNLLHSTDYSDLCYGFAAFNKNAIEKLHPLLKSKNFEFETEVFIKAKKLGLKVVEIPSVEQQRKKGKSNLNVAKDGFRILRTIVLEALKS